MKHVKLNLLMEPFNTLTIDQCDGLINWFQHQKKTGKTISQKTEVIPDHVADYSVSRYSNSGLAQLEDAYLPTNDILCQEQFDLVNDYAAKYGKQIKSMRGLIVTCYPMGGFIHWHCDTSRPDNIFSTAMHLNTDFFGGELQFGIDANGDKQIKNVVEMGKYSQQVGSVGSVGSGTHMLDTIKPHYTVDKKAGHGMIYSSDNWHRVTEVRAGLRYSLLGWFHGGDK